MYSPTSRVLTVLELLQSRISLTGPQLAERLEMDVRTVRRYIEILKDIGIPVEGNIGRYGGYHLRPGFKLPPLMFTNDEALALALGLMGSPWLDLGLPTEAVEGAISKLTRALPETARQRLQAISTSLTISPENLETRPNAALLIGFSEAIQQRQRVLIEYRSLDDISTDRTIEPYGLLGWRGRWYLVAFCCLRQDFRLFRIDRIQKMTLSVEVFVRTEAFDSHAYAIEQLTMSEDRWHIRVEFQASLYITQQSIPNSLGTLSPGPNGTILQFNSSSLSFAARYLVWVNLPFTILQPPELRDAFKDLAAEMTQIATA